MSISVDSPLDVQLDTALPRACLALDTQVLVAIAAGLAEVSSPSDLRPGGSTRTRSCGPGRHRLPSRFRRCVNVEMR